MCGDDGHDKSRGNSGAGKSRDLAGEQGEEGGREDTKPCRHEYTHVVERHRLPDELKRFADDTRGDLHAGVDCRSDGAASGYQLS